MFIKRESGSCMKNLKKLLLTTGIFAGSLVFSGCERSHIIIQPIMDINNDGYMDFYIEQPWGFGVKRTLYTSNEIDKKVEYSTMEIKKDSDLYKNILKNI